MLWKDLTREINWLWGDLPNCGQEILYLSCSYIVNYPEFGDWATQCQHSFPHGELEDEIHMEYPERFN